MMTTTQKTIQRLRAKKAEIEETLALLEGDANVRKVMASMASVGVTIPLEYKQRRQHGIHWTKKPENRERVMTHMAKMAVRIDRRGTTTATQVSK